MQFLPKKSSIWVEVEMEELQSKIKESGKELEKVRLENAEKDRKIEMFGARVQILEGKCVVECEVEDGK